MANVLTPLWALPGWIPGMLNMVLLLTGLFMILLVLIQRGKGGGLAGAFGGSGGSSAFGSRAGDTFTKVTVGVAMVWFVLVMFLIKVTQPTTPLRSATDQISSPEAPAPAPEPGE